MSQIDRRDCLRSFRCEILHGPEEHARGQEVVDTLACEGAMLPEPIQSSPTETRIEVKVKKTGRYR